MKLFTLTCRKLICDVIKKLYTLKKLTESKKITKIRNSESYLSEDSKLDSSPLSDAKMKVARSSLAEYCVLLTPLFLVDFVNVLEAFYDRENCANFYQKPYLF